MPGNDGGVPNAERVAYVADRVRERREARGLPQTLGTVIHKAPSRGTVGELERNLRWPMQRTKRILWSAALGWTGDALSELAEGREPVELPPPAAPPAIPAPLIELLRRLRDLADEALQIVDETAPGAKP